MQIQKLLAVASAAFALASCGGESPSSPTTPPVASVSIDGAPVSVRAGTVNTIRITGRDASGKPVVGAHVSGSVDVGGGSIANSTLILGSDGSASTQWTAGTRVGSTSIHATSGSAATAMTISIMADVPAKLLSITPAETTIVRNTIMPIIIGCCEPQLDETVWKA